MEVKTCNGCNKSLPQTEEFFYRRGKYFFTRCKDCIKNKSKEAYRGKEFSLPQETSGKTVVKNFSLPISLPQHIEEKLKDCLDMDEKATHNLIERLHGKLMEKKAAAE